MSQLAAKFRRSAAALPLMLLAAPLAVFGGGSSLPKEAVDQARAVAHMRVTKVAEELSEEKKVQVVTFSLCGAGNGLGEEKNVSVVFAESKEADPRPFSNAIGDHLVVLFVPKKGGWGAAGWLSVDGDGKFADGDVGHDIGLKAGLEADAVVQLIWAQLKKDDRANAARPRPPTARNQPWNLMRASPLRRVWPFFPR